MSPRQMAMGKEKVGQWYTGSAAPVSGQSLTEAEATENNI